MPTYSKFEDLDIWKDARKQSQQFWKLCKNSNLQKDFRLRDQMNGSSGSVMDNIAEGFDRENNKEFVNFLAFSKASNAEYRSQLFRCYDRDYINKSELDEAINLNEELGRKIRGFSNYLRASSFRGGRYKPQVKDQA